MPQIVDHLIFIHGRGVERNDDRWLHDGLNRTLQVLDFDPVASERICQPHYTDVLDGDPPADARYPPPNVATVDETRGSARDDYDARWEELRGIRGARPSASVQSKAMRQLTTDGATSLFIRKQMPDVHAYVTRDQVRRAVLSKVFDQVPKEGRAVLIGHSLGSRVALDLVHFLPDMLQLEALVTMGSPLSLAPTRNEMLGAGYPWPTHRVRCWVNLFDPDDAITGGLPLEPIFPGHGDTTGREVIDVQVDNGPKPHNAAHHLSQGAAVRLLGPLVSHRRTVDAPAEPLDEEVVQAVLLRGLMRRMEVEAPPGSDRRRRMAAARRIYESQAFAPHHAGTALTDIGTLAEQLGDESARLANLAAFYFTNPFDPFDVGFREHELREGIRWLGVELGIPIGRTRQLFQAIDEARELFSSGNWARWLIGAGAVALVIAAPTTVLGVGAARGLAGAAAIASGLAAVGGAVGGGMVAGIGVVGAVSATGAASAALTVSRMDRETFNAELVRVVALARAEQSLSVGRSGAGAIEALRDLRHELERLRAQHVEVSGPKSSTARDVAAQLRDLDEALSWLTGREDDD